METFNMIINWITGTLPGAVMAVTIVFELLIRIWPTSRAWSLFVPVAMICQKLADAFTAIANFLNNVKPKTV